MTLEFSGTIHRLRFRLDGKNENEKLVTFFRLKMFDSVQKFCSSVKKKIVIPAKRSPCFTSLRPPAELEQSGSDLVLQTPPLFKRMKLPFLATPDG